MDVINGQREIKDSEDESPILTYTVKQFFDQFAQQANNQSKLPTNITKTTCTLLHHINDDCLLTIFSVKSLSLMDLCSLAETCTRFQEITQRIFPKEIAIQIWSKKCYHVSSINYSINKHRAHDIERMFKSFGSILTEISVSSVSENTSNFVFNMVAKYCVNTLQSLKIESINIAGALTFKMKPIFKRLQRLEFVYVSILGNETLFDDLNSLIELSLRFTDVENSSDILENIFPKLERFTYDAINEHQSLLSTFIRRHTSLKILDLDLSLYDSHKIDILQAIGNSCKELQKLKIRKWPEVLNNSCLLPLQALNHLKTLQIFESSFDDLKFIPATGLRELYFYYCIPPKNYNRFDFFTQLTKLHIFLRWNSGPFDVTDIIRRLVNLKQLLLADPWPKSTNHDVLSEETFSKIARIVKGRPNVLTIYCKFKFSYNLKYRAKNENVKLILIDDLRNLPN